MGNRRTVELSLRGIDKSGDSSKTGGSWYSQNTIVRPDADGKPGELVGRPGWSPFNPGGAELLGYSDIARLLVFQNPDNPSGDLNDCVVVQPKDTTNPAGSTGWLEGPSAPGVVTSGNISSNVDYPTDYVAVKEKVYGFWSNDNGSGAFSIFDTAGANTDMAPFTTSIHGRAIEYAINRFFIGSPSIAIEQEITRPDDYQFENAGWTKSNASIGLSGSSRVLTFTTAAGYIQYSGIPFVHTDDNWHTYQQDFYPNYSSEVPLTIEIINDSSGEVIGSRELIIPKLSDADGPLRFGVSAIVEGGFTFSVKIKAGVTSLAATAGSTVIVGLPGEYGALVTPGRFFFTEPGISPDPLPGGYAPRQEDEDAIIWSETDDQAWWRAENYWNLTEAPGQVTAIAYNGDTLVAFKKRGMWVFKLTGLADAPLSFVEFIPGMGCNYASSVFTFGSEIMWLGESNIYRWSFTGRPQPILDIKDIASVGYRAGHSFERLVLYEDYNILIFGSSVNTWVKHMDTGELTIWTSDQSGVFDSEPEDFAIFRKNNQVLLLGIFNDFLVYLGDGFTNDDCTGVGTTAPIEIEHQFAPLISTDPKSMITVESLAITHKILINADVTIHVSYDNGDTFTKLVTVTLDNNFAFIRGASTFVVPVRQTGHRLTFKLTYSDDSTRFKITGVSADVILRGAAQKYSPDVAASTL